MTPARARDVYPMHAPRARTGRGVATRACDDPRESSRTGRPRARDASERTSPTRVSDVRSDALYSILF